MHYSPTLAGGDVPLLYGIRTHLQAHVPGRWRAGCRNCLLYRVKKIFMRHYKLPLEASGYLERVAEWTRLKLPWLGSPESFPALLGLPSARSFWYSWDYA